MSLMDKVETPVAEAQANDGQPTSSESPVVTQNDWYYAENVKGEGEKPEWLKDKYKTAADQAKAYSELEKRLGAFTGAPDKYDLTLPDYPEVQFRDEDPMLKDFLESAKKNGVSQEYVSEILGTYAKALTANIPDAEAEIQKLGANGKEQVQLLAQWGSANLSPDEYGIFKGLITTASAVRLFEKLKMLSTQSEVAPPAGQPPRETEQEVLKLVNDPQYDTNPEFRADVRRRLSNAMKVKAK